MPEAKYPVTVMLSEHVIDLLSEHGDEILYALSELVDQAKTSQPRIEAQVQQETEERRRAKEARAAQMVQDGRTGHRNLRRRLLDLRPDATKQERAAFRANAVSHVARDYGWNPVYADMVIKRHRKVLWAKITTRREGYVLRGFIDGLSNAEIGNRLGLPKHRISHILCRLKVRAKAESITIFDLARRLSPAKFDVGSEAQP